MATIHKRRLVSGEVVWELTHGTGRDRQRLVAGHSREEAQEVLNQFNKQLALHGQAPAADDGVEAVVGQYLEFLRSNRRPGTYRRYERVIRTFCHCFLPVCHPDVQRLRQIKPVHLEEYKIKRLEGGVADVEDHDVRQRETVLRLEAASSRNAPKRQDNAKFGWLGRKRLREKITPRTVNYELQVLRTFFGWAVRRNHMFVNPATPVERMRLSKRVLPKFLTADQLKKLFAACRDGERRLFLTVLLTGMRKGEVVHLTWSDINFELGVIFIQEKPQWQWKPKTDERLIPISPTLREVLLAQHALRRDDQLVFPNMEGHRDTHLLHKLQKICRRAGLPSSTVHALRHSFGAHLRMAGASLADIADLLGHKDLATTQIYAKVHQEHLRNVIAKLTPVVIDTIGITEPDLTAEPGPENRAVRGLLKD
jgi:integrase